MSVCGIYAREVLDSRGNRCQVKFTLNLVHSGRGMVPSGSNW